MRAGGNNALYLNLLTKLMRDSEVRAVTVVVRMENM